MTTGALLLPFALAWPVALACLWLSRSFRRVGAPLAATMALPALVLAFTADTAFEVRAPGLFTSMALGLDAVGRPFLLLTALLWTVVGFHAAAYMRDDPRRASFTGFMLATGTGNIGLTVAQDALSFYLFFALMTFAAYGLVVHTRTTAALRAGRIYIIMAVLGEALILAGLFAITALATDATFAGVPEAYARLAHPSLVAGALLLGFGVKAGIMPVHLWLPLAHPVAPVPASALLSGAMIKAGVLGWLRFLPMGDVAFPGLGVAVIIAGATATLFGAAVGVTQTDAKTVLAYSSISQMGFLTIGVGAMLVVPAAAPLLVLAVAAYAIHHALAKAALFLAVGLVPVDAYRGRWWLVAAALPALALAGAPLTSGAMAKDALKTALGDLPAPWTARIDLVLTAAAVGTTLLMARYLASLLQTQPRPDRLDPRRAAPWLLLVLLSAVAAVWLPRALAPLGELPPAVQPHYIVATLWPVLLGGILAFSTILLVRTYPALTVATVPAGDIVAFLELAAARARRSTASLAAWHSQDRIAPLTAKAATAARGAIDGTARLVETMAAGPGLGAVLCVLALLLFLALR
ncbi:hypothetical protein BH23GEM9_BH23GEM9_32420 [soil metagenome]